MGGLENGAAGGGVRHSSGERPPTAVSSAVPSSGPLVVLVRNEWGEEHVAVGLFGGNDEAVDWATASSAEPGNHGYTYGVMPLIPPAEYVDGEWR